MPEPVANPFNVSSLQTWVTVTGPGVQEVAFPFRKQNFNRAQDPFGNEVLTPVGDPFFAVRVAPTSLGEFTVVQHFSPGTNTTGIVPLNITFLATPPLRDDGFACVDPGFGQFFKLDSDDAAFWLVGENMGWSGVWPYFNGSSRWSNGTGGTFMYDRYLSRLAAAGGNWIRLWLGPSLVSEPSWDGEQGSFLAMSLMGEVPFGEYSLAAAWRIDHVVETCRALGIKITVVLDAQQACCTPGEGEGDVGRVVRELLLHPPPSLCSRYRHMVLLGAVHVQLGERGAPRRSRRCLD